MADMKKIHAFSVKWSERFRKQNIDYRELIDHCMADNCEELNFKMDSGKEFIKLYGDAFENGRELDRIINDIDDVDLLGSAIYSRWSCFEHRKYEGEKILEIRNRLWFIMALNRLSELSK